MHRADDGDGERQLARGRQIAADERAAGTTRAVAHAGNDRAQARDREHRRCGEREHCGDDTATHRRDVARAHLERAPAELPRRQPARPKVHTFDHGVGRHEQRRADRRQDGGVVAHPEHDAGTAGNETADRLD